MTDLVPPRPGDTGLLLYCISDATAPWPGEGLGLRGARLQRMTHGGLAAGVSPVSELSRETAPTAELLEFERVIRSWHAVADVLPMRFGGVLSGEAAVRAHLDEHRDAYVRALARVSGCVEMGVRALVSSPPPPVAREDVAKAAPRSGAAYLEARRHRYSAENRLRDQCAALEQLLLSKAAPLCREHRTELSSPRPGEPALCSLYFLVPRGDVSAFRAAVSSIPDDVPASLTLSGPWPPFNFVD